MIKGLWVSVDTRALSLLLMYCTGKFFFVVVLFAIGRLFSHRVRSFYWVCVIASETYSLYERFGPVGLLWAPVRWAFPLWTSFVLCYAETLLSIRYGFRVYTRLSAFAWADQYMFDG